MTNICSEERTTFERLLIRLDTSPWDAIYRAVIGFSIPLSTSHLGGQDASGWASVGLLLAVLLTLRVFPAAVRKSAPFSDRVRRVWAERRYLAKRHDSYQWRKLFWIGAGSSLYTVFSGHFVTAWIVVALLCLISGAIGLVRWRRVSRLVSNHTRAR
jgi:hypothetical protein